MFTPESIEGIDKLRAAVPEDMQYWHIFGRNAESVHIEYRYDDCGDEIRCMTLLLTDAGYRYRIRLELYNVSGQFGFDMGNSFFSGFGIEELSGTGYEKPYRFHIYSDEQDIDIDLFCDRIKAEMA